jgi:hypothetical protein
MVREFGGVCNHIFGHTMQMVGVSRKETFRPGVYVRVSYGEGDESSFAEESHSKKKESV